VVHDQLTLFEYVTALLEYPDLEKCRLWTYGGTLTIDVNVQCTANILILALDRSVHPFMKQCIHVINSQIIEIWCSHLKIDVETRNKIMMV